MALSMTSSEGTRTSLQHWVSQGRWTVFESDIPEHDAEAISFKHAEI